MSQARPIYKDATIMLTRRVRGRRFLLRPSAKTNQLIRYVLAVMARKWGIKVHAVMVLSNHWHLCVTDPFGNVVEFQRDCHAFIARGLNAAHGEFESVWSGAQASRVTCEGADSLLEKISYTMANPVAAGLVRYGHSWPGVGHSWPCKPIEVARPPKFFRGEEDGGAWPKTATLILARPPGFDEQSDQELGATIEAAIDAKEEACRRDFDAKARRFMGRKKVRAQRRHGCPSTKEKRFQISPQVACRDTWRRIERLAANKAWLVEYKLARDAWMAGDREVLFPHGTYKMRVVHAALCHAPN